MTIVEFYDKTAAENIVSTLLCKPDNVIFVGGDGKKMRAGIALYEKIVRDRGLSTAFDCRVAPRNNLQAIITLLTELAERYEPCLFDLTGGEDLYLVASGMVYARHPSLQLHRFHLASHAAGAVCTLLDCDADGKTLSQGEEALTVEETVQIYGGRVIYSEEKPEGTVRWRFSEEFRKDVRSLWEICRYDPFTWNTQITALARLTELSPMGDGLRVELDKTEAKLALSSSHEKFVWSDGLFRRLYRAGLLTSYRSEGNVVSFTYKNEAVRRCLEQAGKALELYVTLRAMELLGKDSRPVYHDVLNGVFIDWDGVVQPEGKADVENEIDVLMMRGMVPVFVSCKNGTVEAEELYKLSTVAAAFGGKYAKKVLVVSQLEKGTAYSAKNAAYIRARAGELGVKLVENAASLTEEQWERTIAGFGD